MIHPQLPTDENQRIEILRKYEVLDSPPEQALDDLATLAAQICGAPIALISLVDERRQWFKSRIGLDMAETPREISFCAHAVLQRDLFVVSDAMRDERFAQNPLVTGDPGIRFYAGAPLVSPEDAAIGALCVIDRVPRILTQVQQESLRILARQVMAHLELHRYARSLTESESKFRLLADNITDVFWIASPDMQRVYYVSHGYDRIWGRLADDLYANPHQWIEAIVPEDRGRVLEVFAKLMKNEPSVSVEYRISRPDGTLRWVHDRGFQVRDAAGRLERLTGIVTDTTERKKAELAMVREIAIVTSSDDAIIGKDLNGIITNWNKGAEKIFGYTADEMIGTSIMRLIPDARKAEENLILDEINHGRSVEHFETQRTTKDGRLINVSVTASPIKDASGKAIGVSKVARDITERKRAEEARRATEARYRALFEHAPDGIVVVDSEGYYLDANSAICQMLGYTHGELIKLHASDVVAPSEIKEIEPALKVIKPNSNYHREWQFRRKNGSIFTADVIATGMPEGNLVAMIRDISEQKIAQEQIAEQAALLEKARDAILVRDLEGRILFWNHGAERVYGWKREDVIGRNVGEILYPQVAKFNDLNALVLATGEWNGELHQITRDKRDISIEARWTLIRDKMGGPKSILAINTDITEKKQIEAQFMRAQRMESIGTLAGGVAHDLNNILSPIMLAVGILKQQSNDPNATKILDTVELSAKRGADIVRQVLSFARGIEGERIEVQPKHLLRDLENIISNTFPKDIRLEFSMPTGLWALSADPTQLHQILLNLCVNARDAMPQGGKLSVGVENCTLDEHYAAMHIEAKAGRYVSIVVTDSGTGIPPSILDKIFEPFFTTKPINKGTGLGLSTVLAIVKSHGGFVNVYSESGNGTTFKVYLPALEASSEELKHLQGKPALPRGNGETVLVVDDETSILTITGKTLEAFGYRVLTATDGAEAIAVYVQNKDQIGVVLTDMMMPVMDGTATIKALIRVNPNVKIIAASGLNAKSAEVKSSGAEVRHFLTKPYTAETLLKTIRTILDESQFNSSDALIRR